MMRQIKAIWHEPVRKGELVGIQYLRGFAVVGVALAHGISMGGFDKYFGELAFGGRFSSAAVGVDLFFVISGFIISIVSLKSNSLDPRMSVGAFLWRRFVRIIPLMWIAILSYAALRYAARGELNIDGYIRALTLWPFGSVDPNPIWSLRREWIFYFLFAACMMVSSKRMSRHTWIVLLWCFLPLLADHFRDTENVDTLENTIVGVIFHPSNVQFGLGLLLGLAYLRRPDWFSGRQIGRFGFWICGGLALLIYISAGVGNLTSHLAINTLTLGLICCGAVAASIFVGSEEGVWSRIGRMLGDASFSIYLFHFHFESALLGVWAKLAPHTPVEIVVTVVVIAAIVAGVFIHYLVERPLLAGMRHLGGLRRSPAPSPAVPVVQLSPGDGDMGRSFNP